VKVELTVRISKQRESYKKNNSLIFFILIHIPLALLLKQFSLIATLHGWAIFLVGVFLALTDSDGRRVAYIAAYIAGSDVLWRMTSARVFWEMGKYAIIAVMLLYLLRKRQFKSAGLPIFYFGLLVVSMPLTLDFLPLNLARDAISFNLSGPLSLAVSAIFFLQITLDWQDREKLSQYLIAPVIGIGSISVWTTSKTQNIIFTGESNFITSGGFGPSQVSAMLGLGALLLLLLAFQQPSWFGRLLPLGGSLGLATLSALTFSRGGIYNLAASLFVLVVFSLRNARLRNTFIPLLVIGYFVANYLIYPQLDDFTGGMLTARFADINTTGRYEIMQSNLNVWQQNPLLGMGPGMAMYVGELVHGYLPGAHTEYTRLLAEHGVLGLVAILILIIITLKALHQAPQGLPRAWVAAMLAWSFMEMGHAAMRVAAIGFLIGLAMALWPNFPAITKKDNNHEGSSHR